MALTLDLLGACAVVFVAILLWNVYSSPLNHVPGPLVARFTNLWRLVDVWNNHSDLTELQLHRRYGPYVRLAPNTVSIADPTLIAYAYSTRAPLQKSDFYCAADNVTNGQRVSSVFSTRSEDDHTMLTRPVKSSYSLSRMLHFEGRIDSALDHFIAKLKSFADKPSPCPLGDMLLRFAWDVSGELNFSKRFGALDGDPRALNLIAEVSKAMSYLSIIGQIPVLDRLLQNPIYPVRAPGFGYAIDFAVDSLSSRVQTRKYADQRDFIDLFIDAENNKAAGGTGAQFTSRQISWLASNVIAGSDSTAASLQAAVYHVARDSAIKARLNSELAAAFPPGTPVTWKTALALSYLDAVAHETFRLEPGVGMPLERVVPEPGLRLPTGAFLPPGTVIGMNARVVGRDAAIFGADADTFRPERWLRAEGEDEPAHGARVARMKAADLTFGRGSRSCMGKPIALLEVYKCLARLFLEFEVDLVAPEKELDAVNRWFMTIKGVDVHLKARFA